MRFCSRLSRLYGSDSITPNMHMHAHLASCVRDYGPLHSFWLFSFERYNGLLGSQPNNNRSIEVQLMSRFLKDNMHLELLHKADTQSLVDAFLDIDARKFNSVAVTGTDSAQPPLFSDPTKYTLTVLLHSEIIMLRTLNSTLPPEYLWVLCLCQVLCRNLPTF